MALSRVSVIIYFKAKGLHSNFYFGLRDFWITEIYRTIIVLGYDITIFTLNHDNYRTFTMIYRNGS